MALCLSVNKDSETLFKIDTDKFLDELHKRINGNDGDEVDIVPVLEEMLEELTIKLNYKHTTGTFTLVCIADKIIDISNYRKVTSSGL